MCFGGNWSRLWIFLQLLGYDACRNENCWSNVIEEAHFITPCSILFHSQGQKCSLGHSQDCSSITREHAGHHKAFQAFISARPNIFFDLIDLLRMVYLWKANDVRRANPGAAALFEWALARRGKEAFTQRDISGMFGDCQHNTSSQTYIIFTYYPFFCLVLAILVSMFMCSFGWATPKDKGKDSALTPLINKLILEISQSVPFARV